MSGFKEPERGKLLILIYDYAQNVRVLAGRHSNRTCRSPFQQHLQVAIPTALAGRHSNSTCTSPFQQYLQVVIPTALAGCHSKSTFRAPFQQYFQSAIPTVVSERHSKSLPTPPTQKPSKSLYNYLAWVRFVVISLCCVLVAVG